MRLFVAVEMEPAVAARADALIGELRRRAERLSPHARITWVPAERLHLTVRFIGNVDDDQVRAIVAALQAPLDAERFDLTLAGTGAFPNGGKPRVLWAGVTDGREALRGTEREVSLRLELADVPPEDRVYSPHLTLARIRDAAGLKSARLFEGISATVLGTTRVEAITLFESRLSPKGPTYVAMQRTPLRASRQT
jgi:RNA 2',3'-cyclic 3'-phosphodiesterase